MLREKPVPIPLDPLMGMALRDPRSQLQQFSHIKKDVILNKPSFSKAVLWSPEDLIPIPIPKQDLLPLPPGIPPVTAVDPRLSRTPPQHHSAAPPSIPPPAASAEQSNQPSSSLPDFELLSRIIKTVNATSSSPAQAAPAGMSSPPSASAEKPVDPRMARKAPADPRLQPQKSALKSTSEPPAPQVSPPAASLSPSSSSPTIAPYDPRLLSAGGSVRSAAGGGGSSGSSSVLSGISLYDPRTQGTDKPDGSGAASPPPEPKSSESQPTKPKAKEPLFVRKSALDQPEPEKSTTEQTTDRYNSYNRPRPKPSPSPNAGAAGGAPASGGPSAAGQGPAGATEQPAGVHNLPVSTLFTMVKQAGKPSGTGSPFGGNSPAQPDTTEQDNASLKDVFKGFDPTASPFCQ